MMLKMFRPISAIRINIRKNAGKVITSSVKRIRILSTLRPEYPETSPITVPMAVVIAAETSPTLRETRPPKISRANRSRPASSVPSLCSHLGDSVTLSRFTYSGWCLAMYGAKTAANDSSPRIASPTKATLWRLNRRHVVGCDLRARPWSSISSLKLRAAPVCSDISVPRHTETRIRGSAYA